MLVAVSSPIVFAAASNFGEPQLVAETEAGLRELGLHELALCFVEAQELMLPLLPSGQKLSYLLRS